jgi:three-Cys-motif partner protein
MKKQKINFNEVQNSNCLKKCNREKRQEVTEEDLCKETVSVIDQLPIRCVGAWALRKIFHLTQYFGIFSTAMKDKWDGNINYIEICSGLGRCINRTSGMEFNGTSICIIEHEAFRYLNKAIFIDYNKIVVDTLNKRLGERNITKAKAIQGNYYEPVSICNDIIHETQGNGLNLVFIDPTDCSVPFDLLIEIKRTLQNVDFIVNFAIGTDVNRNIRNALLQPEKHQVVIQKYISFLGSDSFFRNADAINASLIGNNKLLRKLFREEYMNSLRSIGYEHTDFKQIENYYDLVFASTHPRGIEFWRKANAISYDGQRSLF